MEPVIYLIDDKDQSDVASVLRRSGVEAEYLYPTEVAPDHLRRATLLAIDEYFDLRSSAPDDDLAVPLGAQLALVPEDGLSLAAVLRSAARRGEIVRSRPFGISLRTGELDKLAGEHPRAVRQPFLAAQHDLEWVAPKEHLGGVPPLEQLVSLAQALAEYPQDWRRPDARGVGARWLQVPAMEWAALARDQVQQSRPPTHVHVDSAHGLGWLRWLAHRALPFPTFVVSDVYVATHLGVTLDSLHRAVEVDERLHATLESFRYTGPLAGTQTSRFWRAGIDALATDLVGFEDADDTVLVGRAMKKRHPVLEPLEIQSPVVTINAEYEILPSPVSRAQARRLAPDGWPAYAEPAWTSVENAEDPEMADLLAPSTQ